MVLAFATRSFFTRWRGNPMSAGRVGKTVLADLLVIIGIAILTGFERRAEAAIRDRLSDRIMHWSTAF